MLNQYVLVLTELARENVLLLPYWKIASLHLIILLWACLQFSVSNF
jgi:hypothetical protein